MAAELGRYRCRSWPRAPDPWATCRVPSRRTRLAQLKQTLHEKRLESYPNLVKAAKPLALYLSRIEESSPGDIIEKLKEMGLAMRNWYLDEGGGLLLSAQTRDAYFLLARALTRACAVQGSLRFPKRGAWLEVSQEKVQKYGKELRLPKATRLRKWQNARLRNGITQGQWRSGRSASFPHLGSNLNAWHPSSAISFTCSGWQVTLERSSPRISRFVEIRPSTTPFGRGEDKFQNLRSRLRFHSVVPYGMWLGRRYEDI